MFGTLVVALPSAHSGGEQADDNVFLCFFLSSKHIRLFLAVEYVPLLSAFNQVASLINNHVGIRFGCSQSGQDDQRPTEEHQSAGVL